MTHPAQIDERELDYWLRIDVSGTERMVRRLSEWYWDHVFRLRAYCAENIPERGAFVFCPNHSSYADPFLQARGQQRLIRFMTKSQVFDWPLIGRMVRSGGGFPVRRGSGDTFAIELARRMLLDGQAVCIYAEGTRFRTDDQLGPPRRGAARLALEARVPVVPVGTYGAKPRAARGERWFPPRLPKVTTVYGKPLDFSHLENTPENVDRVRDEVWAEVTRLYHRARELHSQRPRPVTVDC